MKIGIPREIKPQEGRVALLPAACEALVRGGHTVVVEQGAGVLSGYTDAQYTAAGATIAGDAAATYGEAELIIKVKEPVESDLALLREDHTLFSFLHLAPAPELTARLQSIGLTAIGFETVATASGDLPLLAPMSDIAGRIATQVGTHLLHRPQGGKGILLGGLPGTRRGRVLVIGAGHAGGNAAAMAAAIGADVTVFDVRRERLADMRQAGANITTLYPYPDSIAKKVAHADLLIAAALRPGSLSPHIVTRDMVETMQPGSVIVDISVDQGGCVETTRPRTYEQPTYVELDIVHFCVTNMPGAVPHTASQALSAALLPYVERLARPDWREDRPLQQAINVQGGEVVHPALKEALD
ncbi:MAG: alanine dehydrogenase [Halobacteria archaeon]|nr:alanine dehydrogenase [Halobacteria archaeon]